MYDEECDGQKVDSIQSINMIKHFNNIIVCARRGGKNFLDSTRINPQKEKCLDKLIPCIKDTKAT